MALPSPRAPLSFLSTFIHNMLAFGLTKKLCSDFLKKQATIGNLDEGGAGGDAMHTTPPPLSPGCFGAAQASLSLSPCRAIQAAQRPH